jgi:hypothetical protein
MGVAGAQTQGATPAATSKAADSTAKNRTLAPVVNAGKKSVLTAEEKSFEQSLKALREQSDKMNEKYVKAARQQEKARREKEQSTKTAQGVPSGQGKK